MDRQDAASHHDRVLVALVKRPADLALARDQHWYRVPVSSADKLLGWRWPPRWLAFYQPKSFGRAAFLVNYFGQVLDIRVVPRWQLFPNEPRHKHSEHLYYQIFLGPLQSLPQPLVSRSWRRIVFITTTWGKFMAAQEINDLFDDSPLEDRLWRELKSISIGAERQEDVSIKKRRYFLGFAVYCARGKLDIETDGDTWHSDPSRIPLDNVRDNDLETAGWSLLRFNTRQVQEPMRDCCLPTIVEKIEKLGGVEAGRAIPRRVTLQPKQPSQLNFFDDLKGK